jgi:hypothetical protein
MKPQYKAIFARIENIERRERRLRVIQVPYGADPPEASGRNGLVVVIRTFADNPAFDELCRGARW